MEQSLADIAAFIHYLRLFNQEYTPKIILWGSGYGGTMATWARKKYPHLVDGVNLKIDLSVFNVFSIIYFARCGHRVEYFLLTYTVHVSK